MAVLWRVVRVGCGGVVGSLYVGECGSGCFARQSQGVVYHLAERGVGIAERAGQAYAGHGRNA